jgi:long-chain fatty acid transport protein
MRRAPLLAAFAVAVAASPARAGIEDSLGLGARAMSLGGSYAARPGDFASAYYNPAGLAPGGRVEEHGGFFEASLGYVYAHPTLHVTGPGGRELSTPEAKDTSGAVVGARFSVGQPFGVDGLDMGLSLFVPAHLFDWSIRPDDDVQWALLTDRTQVMSTHLGLAWRAARWLSIGIGLRVLFDAQTLTRGEVTGVALENDPQTGKPVIRTTTRLGTDAQVFGRVSPLMGITLTPVDELRIGLVYRQKSYVDDWGNTIINGVPELGTMGFTHEFAHYFEPSEATAAVSADLGPRLDVSADLTFARWSEALSTNRNFFGSGIWGDTWTPAFGARFRAAPHLSLMGGYRFQKSPLDNLGGPSNLLDNDRHVASLGAEVDVADFRFTAGVQETFLVERTETKDFRRFASDDALLANPGYPSYHYGGHMIAGTAAVEARW